MEGMGAENASGERCVGTEYWREPIMVSFVGPEVTIRVPLLAEPAGPLSSPGVLVRLHDHSDVSETLGKQKYNNISF